mgnify:CR=1 FL=1
MLAILKTLSNMRGNEEVIQYLGETEKIFARGYFQNITLELRNENLRGYKKKL